MKILIKNGHVIDPVNNIDGIYDILVENDKISEVAKNITTSADNIIDAADKIVMPGIVDMHVHLREPGREDKETITTGTMAALRGGVTSILAMPNTQPAIDCAENVELLKSIINKTAKANVFICAAITKERLGKELTDILKLKREGIVAISDDGSSVDNDELMLPALQKAKEQDILVISHCEDKLLSAGGAVNLGIISTRLGLRGIARESEYKRVERDLKLAEKAKARLHIAHVSCKESVELIAKAKKKGIKVTAEVTPHHFSLSAEAALGFDTNMKMNPPLRSQEDKEALKEGLKNGIIDAIASDHAPHTENEKEIEFERAEFGVIGLETELAVSITELVKTGLLDWLDLAKKLCLNPAKILGVDKPSSSCAGLGKGTLGVGCDADILVVSPDKEWVVQKEEFVSKSKNSAFLGKKLTGAVEYTICNGRIAYKNTN
jgi:dihydroorotase